MSHTLYPLRRQRLQRSELAVPASNPSMIDKAAEGPADYVFLDLEDAVAPPEKEQARKNCIQALNDIDWAGKGKTVSVRINGLDTHYMYRDVVDVMEQAGSRVHTLLVPKVGVRDDLYMVEAMVNQIEQAKGYTTRVGLEALIETALGMANVESIAQFGGRLEALHFGVADYAASMRARTTNIGGLNLGAMASFNLGGGQTVVYEGEYSLSEYDENTEFVDTVTMRFYDPGTGLLIDTDTATSANCPPTGNPGIEVTKACIANIKAFTPPEVMAKRSTPIACVWPCRADM